MPWEMRFSTQFMLLLPLHSFHSGIGVWFVQKFQTKFSVYTTFINTMSPELIRWQNNWADVLEYLTLAIHNVTLQMH